MASYKIVMTPEYFGVVQRGAFDHWIGEAVPLRGPDRRIIGEAKVTDLDHREDGNVYLTVETTVTNPTPDSVKEVLDKIRGAEMPAMSFGFRGEVSLPHQPKRGDDVARWLKRLRDSHNRYSEDWPAIDDILEEYRARADYGFTLDEDMSHLEGRW